MSWKAPFAITLLAAAALAAWLFTRPRPLPTGELVAALEAEGPQAMPAEGGFEFDLSPLFARFLPPAMTLAQRRGLLEANGFTCATGAQFKNGRPTADRRLECVRPTSRNSIECDDRWLYSARFTPDGRMLASPDASRVRRC